jgi:two-component system, response regulator
MMESRPGAILLVEDNPDHEALTLRALRKHALIGPNTVHVARDGAEAIAQLFPAEPAQGARPDLILLDLKLPKVDGFEVLRRLRADERTRYIPVIVLTSSDDQGDVLNAYRAGANSYIRKPVDFDAFMEATRQIGLYWLSLNEVPGRRN